MGAPFSRRYSTPPVSMPSFSLSGASAEVHTCSSSRRSPRPLKSGLFRSRFPPRLLTGMTLRRFGLSACTANPEGLSSITSTARSGSTTFYIVTPFLSGRTTVREDKEFPRILIFPPASEPADGRARPASQGSLSSLFVLPRAAVAGEAVPHEVHGHGVDLGGIVRPGHLPEQRVEGSRGEELTDKALMRIAATKPRRSWRRPRDGTL